jgi:hypothetical protein
MDGRIDHLVELGLARCQGQRVIFARDLIDTLRRRDLEEATSKLSAETGLACRPSPEGEHVSGVYRQRVTLASGRFAMIDDGMGVPTRALATGAGTTAWPPSRRRDYAWQQRRLELQPEAGARYLTTPPTAESGGCGPLVIVTPTWRRAV